MYQNNLNKNATDFPIPDYSLFDAGAYLFAKWKYEKWTIGGIRSDLRYLKANDFILQQMQTGFGQHVSPADDQKQIAIPSFDKSFGISLSLGTTYQLNDQVSLKANIARGIVQVSRNLLQWVRSWCICFRKPGFKPEFSLQEDIGADITLKTIHVI
ncbi:hypothetical protein CS542_09545 [Pedobacter sp. IW39]|nr:hypothetical protein CS542_09545 [Pedobacter sp. IW39]